MHWHAPVWWMRGAVAGLRLGSLARRWTSRLALALVPLEWSITAPYDEQVIELLRHDPLSFKRVTLRMASMLGARLPAPVPYEACHTPVQLIASEFNRIWRYDVVVNNYHRLAGPKQLVTLHGAGQW